MPSTHEQIGALLPDCIPKGRTPLAPDLSARAKKARWSPKSHTDAEVAEARRVITHWNKLFRGVDGASIAQVNNMSNVRLYIRTLHRCREEGDLFAHITERAICAAIDAYRIAPYNVKAHVWKSFADWLDPESILKYAGQSSLADHRATQPRREHQQLTALQEKAKVVLDNRGFARFFSSIAIKAIPLAIYLNRGNRNTPEVEKFLELVRALKARRDGLDGPSRGALLQRARAVFDAYFGRPPKTDADSGIMEGLEFSLLDLDATGRTRSSAPQASAPEVRHA